MYFVSRELWHFETHEEQARYKVSVMSEVLSPSGVPNVLNVSSSWGGRGYCLERRASKFTTPMYISCALATRNAKEIRNKPERCSPSVANSVNKDGKDLLAHSWTLFDLGQQNESEIRTFLAPAAESVICADLTGHVLWDIGWWNVYQLCHRSWRQFDWSGLCHCDSTARPGNFGLRRCGQGQAGVMKSSQHHHPLSLHHRHHDVSFLISRHHHHHFGERLPAACDRVPFLWICLLSPGPRDREEHGQKYKSTKEG